VQQVPLRDVVLKEDVATRRNIAETGDLNLKGSLPAFNSEVEPEGPGYAHCMAFPRQASHYNCSTHPGIELPGNSTPRCSQIWRTPQNVTLPGRESAARLEVAGTVVEVAANVRLEATDAHLCASDVYKDQCSFGDRGMEQGVGGRSNMHNVQQRRRMRAPRPARLNSTHEL